MSGKNRRRSWSRILTLFLSAVVFIFGCCIWVYPYANGVWMDYTLRKNAKEFLSFVKVDPAKPKEDVTHVIIQPTQPESTEVPEETLPEQYPELWQQMKEYNERIYREEQSGLSDASSYEKPSFLLSDFGLESEVFGVLSIPALNLEMPLYLGATYRHMADGAAQMSETSIPIGGINTNCVIAGHRGWNGAAYFLHIPNLKKGDILTITNLWETLTYEVVETKIITPTDVEAIHIRENRDLITLLTCHPPATGGRERYLVFCERITELEVP